MISKKLIELLKSFSKYELNRFRKYLQSPFFNENEALIHFFSFLDNALRYSDTIINKERIWKKLFPSQAYNDTKFRRLCSDLGALAQNFLALKGLKKSRQLNSFLLKELNERNLSKHFNTVERNLRKQQEKQVFVNSEYYYIQYLLEHELDVFQQKDIRRSKTINLEEADKQLDYFYFSKKLKNFADALNYQNVVNLEIPFIGKEDLLRYIKSNNYLEEASIRIYYQIMQMLESFEEDHYFDELLELLNIYSKQFPPTEIRNMYIFAQNYCIKKINSGKRVYFRKLFEIYQLLLQKEIIFNKGELLPWDYKNIVTIGLRLGEFDWIEQFIQNYNDYLPDNFRQNALIYNMAQLYFHRKAYEKVILLLREVVYQDIFYTLDSKWILLKTYYEIKETTAMDSLMESFRIFLIRHKVLSKANKQPYFNLLRYLKRLSRLSGLEKDKIKALKKNVEEEQEIPEKSWLLAKLEEFN